MTFSIAARCARTGQFGIAIASSSPAVAARCAHVRAGVGVVGSQNITDPRLGPAALGLMAGGASARTALDTLAARETHIDYRQLVAVDDLGRTAIRSGRHALGIYAGFEGRDCAAAGNLLAHDGVPAAMATAFEAAAGELGGRLMAALAAGLAAGGEAGLVHSAGLVVADTEAWPLVDLRVDWDETDPIGRLRALWDLWEPQMHAYVQRALSPEASPSFGVPGDE